ncbi:MAG TPA: tRNA pseudouridine(13) synthase TruD [Tepidisphaeraceae bacterium]|jgi:tRNA pseudouridine13 synthase|nr:tRNA pseudouridine(13) synthase TruD [Tepidisphaeraceae bacterium]
MILPYSTPQFPGVGGVLKQRPEDFFVQELPLYEPSGQGEHVYCEIQKIGMTTFQAIDRIAAALHVSTRDIGYAGLKDARAITRQIFSIVGTTEQAVMGLHIPDMTIQWAARHANKIRLGHLAGNRFAVKIREVNPTDVVKLTPLLDTIQQQGMPNYFGEQRFGRRGNNDLLGATLIRGRPEELLKLLLGSPNPKIDDPQTATARSNFDRHDLDGAMKGWPRSGGLERRILARLVKTKKPGEAVRAVDEKLRRLWVSALQSRLFNEVAAHRIASLNKLIAGDLAYKHENGACFLVEDTTTEQPRCDAFEISPTGPLVGYRMTPPQHEALKIEEAVFKSHGLTPGHFKQEGRDRAKGARRPLRVQPKDIQLAAGVDEHGSHITVAFTLPAGSYATVLLRELMKNDQAPTDQPETPAEPDDSDAPE